METSPLWNPDVSSWDEVDLALGGDEEEDEEGVADASTPNACLNRFSETLEMKKGILNFNFPTFEIPNELSSPLRPLRIWIWSLCGGAVLASLRPLRIPLRLIVPLLLPEPLQEAVLEGHFALRVSL